MPPLISLVPNSGIHFWDVDLDADALPRQARTFWEEPLGGPADENGAARVKLHELVPDPETRQMVEALMADLVTVVAQPVECQVGGDAKQPGTEFGGGPVVSRAIDPQEHLLRQFLGDRDIAHQTIDVADHGTAVFFHDPAKAGTVAGLEGQHPRHVLFEALPNRQGTHGNSHPLWRVGEK